VLLSIAVIIFAYLVGSINFAVIFSKIPSFAEADSFIDVMRPWAYVCIFIACAAFLWGAIVTLRAIPFKSENARCNCDEVDSLTI
jgi:glycerol-3-phosphate acyltransferase PlsY